MLTLDAAKQRDAGLTIEEVAKWVEDNRLHYNMFATVDTLSYLKASGRISGAAAFFGNIFGVKPIIISDAKGNNFAVEKAKGRRNALLRIAAVAAERATDKENSPIYVSEADAKPEDIELLVSQLKLAGFKNIVPQKLGPILSASCGPATVGLFYKGQKETRLGE